VPREILYGILFLIILLYDVVKMVYYLCLAGISFILSAVLAGYTWKHRDVPGAAAFLLTLLCIIGMIIVQAGEILSTSLKGMTAYANLYYLFIQYAPVCFLLLCLQFTGTFHPRRYPKQTAAIFFVIILIPIITQVLLWTNDFHQLMRRDAAVDASGTFVLMSKTYGPVFLGAAAYNFLLTLLSFAVLIKAMGTKNRLLRDQAALFLISLLLPTASTAGTVFGIFHIGIDPTPAVFGLSSIIMFWGIYRWRLFSAVPIAHSTIIESMDTGIIVFDTHDNIVDINPAAVQLFSGRSTEIPSSVKTYTGSKAETVLSTQPKLLELYRSSSSDRRELFLPDSTASPSWFEVYMTPLYSAQGQERLLGCMMILYDITYRKQIELEIRRMSQHDPLTGLPNRAYFFELAEHELLQAEQKGTLAAAVFIDLDDLKVINDTLGHSFGDFYLKETARRLKTAFAEDISICRLGGDEFALLICGITEYQDITGIGDSILDVFSSPVSAEQQVSAITASIGISAYPADGKTIEELLKKADDLMYASKHEGKNRCTLSQSVPLDDA